MATLRQKKLAEELVLNSKADKPLNKQTLVAKVGYSEISADKKATEIIKSKGVQEELSILGFDPNTARGVVSEILQSGEEDRDRLKAADMIFKVHGTYAAEKRVNLNVNSTLDTRLDALIEQIEDELDYPTEGTT